MVAPTEFVSILAGGLALLVVSSLAFGHKYSAQSGRLDEKSKIDELSEIRIGIRSDATIPVLGKIWSFLVETDQSMRKEGLTMQVTSLLYDTNRREYFNRLINDLERTFRDDTQVRMAWDNSRSLYGKLGNALYGFAAIMALAGYPLLVLSSPFAVFLSLQQCYSLWILLAVVGVAVLGIGLYLRQKAQSNLKIYMKYKQQYLVDELRISK